MNTTKFTLNPQNLRIDYLSFNISKIKNIHSIYNLAEYLYQLGFQPNILIDSQPIKIKQYVGKTLRYKVTILKNYKYWEGYIVQFSGTNSAYFYKLVKMNLIDLKILQSVSKKISIGRIDVCYSYYSNNLVKETKSLELFMEGCCKKVRAYSKIKKAKWELNSKGFLLTIGDRSSSNYIRVYTNVNRNPNELKFELEVKKKYLRSIQSLFFNHQFETFETNLLNYFFQQLKKSLILDTEYTHWLLTQLRNTNKSIKSFVSHYLTKTNFNSQDNIAYFYKLLLFLSFIRTLKGSRYVLKNQVYYTLDFSLSEFLEFLKIKNKQQYQRQKALDFLSSLMNLPPLIQKFSDTQFRKSVIFPYVEITKKNRRWVVSIAIIEQLYFTYYPFQLPESFMVQTDLQAQRVHFAIIESYCQKGIVKIFPIYQFLNSFNLSNTNLRKVKKYIIQSFQEMESIKLISNSYKLCFRDGNYKIVDHLQIKFLTKKLNYIQFYESV